MKEKKVSLLTCNLFIGQYIHLIGGKGMGKGDENKNRYLARCVFQFIREYEKSGVRSKY